MQHDALNVRSFRMKRLYLLVAIICLLLMCIAWFPYFLLQQRISAAEHDCLPRSQEVQCVVLPKMKTAQESAIKWSAAESAVILVIGAVVLTLARKRRS